VKAVVEFYERIRGEATEEDLVANLAWLISNLTRGVPYPDISLV